MAVSDFKAKLHAAVVGDPGTAEMRDVLLQLTRYIPQSNQMFAKNVDHFSELLQNQSVFCEIIVICQNWPDEYKSGDVIQLMTLSPLSRLICCQSLWCESDGRNRDVWPLSLRVAARSFAARIDSEFQMLTGTKAAIPVTASRDELIGLTVPQINSCNTQIKSQIKYSLDSPDMVLRGWFNALLQKLGCEPAADIKTAELLIWDIDPVTPERLEALIEIAATCSHKSIYVLAGMILPEDIELLKSHGVELIINKYNATAEIVHHFRHMRMQLSADER